MLSNFGEIKNESDFDYKLLKYTYSIPGINKIYYDSFVDNWNNSSDNKIKSLHLTTKYSKDYKYIINDFPEENFSFILGNYDLIFSTNLFQYRKNQIHGEQKRDYYLISLKNMIFI